MAVRGRLVQADGPTADDGAVLLEGGRVAYAGPAARAPRLPDEGEVIDVGDGVIVPGLIDPHVHLTCDGGPDLRAEVAGLSGEALGVKAVRNALRHLAAGVVVVRDLGAPGPAAIAVGDAVERGVIAGPEVTAAGRAVTTVGGHIPFLGREVAGADEVANAVAEEIAGGAGGVKLVATGGILTPDVPIGDSALTQAEMAAAVRPARAAGGWVAAHVIGLEATKAAVRAGVTTLEHAVFLDDEAIELIRSRGVTIVATLIALMRILEGGEAGGVPAASVAKAESVAQRHVDSIRAAVAAGLPVAAGTDAGTPFNPHGGLADEAALLVEHAGMSPAQALRAATVTAAGAIGRDDLGRLVPGAADHLTVLGGDPRDGVAALRDIRQVIAGSCPIGRGALANLLRV